MEFLFPKHWHRAYRRPLRARTSLSISIPFSAAASWYQRLQAVPAEGPSGSIMSMFCTSFAVVPKCASSLRKRGGLELGLRLFVHRDVLRCHTSQTSAIRSARLSSIGASLLPHAVCASSVPIRSLRTSTSNMGQARLHPRAGPAHRRADGPNRAGCRPRYRSGSALSRAKRSGRAQARVGGIEHAHMPRPLGGRPQELPARERNGWPPARGFFPRGDQRLDRRGR